MMIHTICARLHLRTILYHPLLRTLQEIMVVLYFSDQFSDITFEGNSTLRLLLYSISIESGIPLSFVNLTAYPKF